MTDLEAEYAAHAIAMLAKCIDRFVPMNEARPFREALDYLATHTEESG